MDGRANRPGPAQLGLPLALLLLAAAAAIVAGSALTDFRGRAGSPEATVRRYFAALQAGEPDLALLELASAARERDASFVQHTAGNEYHVVGTAVRATSLLDRLRGEPPGPREVTTFLHVTETVSGERWQAAPRVALVRESGRWLLARAPLVSD